MSFLSAADYDRFERHIDGAVMALVPFIGERAVRFFTHSISKRGQSVLASARSRQALVESGEDPDQPQVTEVEQLLIRWGEEFGCRSGLISDSMDAELRAAFNPSLRALLLEYACLLVAADTYLFAARVPLDESLDAMRK